MPVNGSEVTVHGYGGPSMLMLSAVDGPAWTKCDSREWSGWTIHGFCTWSGGTDGGWTIGSVTGPKFLLTSLKHIEPKYKNHL